MISVNLDDFNFNILQTFIQLSLLIFAPYILGFYLNRKEVKIVKKTSPILDKILKVYILIITITGPYELREPLINYFNESIILVFSSIFSIYVLQNITSKLTNISKVNDRTVLIEALCQNFPIVLTLSIILNIPEMAIFGIIYLSLIHI